MCDSFRLFDAVYCCVAPRHPDIHSHSAVEYPQQRSNGPWSVLGAFVQMQGVGPEGAPPAMVPALPPQVLPPQALRPEFGTLGKPMLVRVNQFRVQATVPHVYQARFR